MKKIGIICAMREELIAIKRQMDVHNTKEKATMLFYEGLLNETPVVLVKCGVGKIEAAVCTQLLIDCYGTSCILSTGMAGGLHPSLQLEDIVIATDEAGQPLLEKMHPGLEQVMAKPIHRGVLASEDPFVECVMPMEIDSTFTTYYAEMEVGAIAHTCAMNAMPYLVLRSISDTISQSEDVDFGDFAHASARNIWRMTEYLIEHL